MLTEIKCEKVTFTDHGTLILVFKDEGAAEVYSELLSKQGWRQCCAGAYYNGWESPPAYPAGIDVREREQLSHQVIFGSKNHDQQAKD